MSENVPPPYGEQPPNPYGQQPPGYGPPPGYGAPPGYYGQPPYGPPRDHPSTTTVLVLGILGLVACQVLSPIAWVMGNRVVREIDASGGQLGGRAMANAGRICGIIGSILLGLSIIAVLFVLVISIGVLSNP